jgi:hypothetical protein
MPGTERVIAFSLLAVKGLMWITCVWVTTHQVAKCQLSSGLASKNTNPLTTLARFVSPLTDPFYILSQLFSDLASGNTELLASLKCLEKLIHIPGITISETMGNTLATTTKENFILYTEEEQE